MAGGCWDTYEGEITHLRALCCRVLCLRWQLGTRRGVWVFVCFFLFVAAEYPSWIRCGQEGMPRPRGGMAPPFPSVFSPGMGYDGRHGFASNTWSLFSSTRCRQQLQGHQTGFPTALQAWARFGAPLQVKPHPRDRRLSSRMEPEESLHCPSPARCSTAGPMPGPLLAPRRLPGGHAGCGAGGCSALGRRR